MLTKDILLPIKLGNIDAVVARRTCSEVRGTSVSERSAQTLFRFLFRDRSLEEKPRVGPPLTLDKYLVDEEINQKPHQTCKELAYWFGAADEIIRSHLHNLRMTWKLRVWVSSVLYEENKI